MAMGSPSASFIFLLLVLFLPHALTRRVVPKSIAGEEENNNVSSVDIFPFLSKGKSDEEIRELVQVLHTKRNELPILISAYGWRASK